MDIHMVSDNYGYTVGRREPVQDVLHLFQWDASSLELVYMGFARTDIDGYFEKTMRPGRYLLVCHYGGYISLDVFLCALPGSKPGTDVFGISEFLDGMPIDRGRRTLVFRSQGEEADYLKATVGRRCRLQGAATYEKMKEVAFQVSGRFHEPHGALEVIVRQDQVTMAPWARTHVVE